MVSFTKLIHERSFWLNILRVISFWVELLLKSETMLLKYAGLLFSL